MDQDHEGPIDEPGRDGPGVLRPTSPIARQLIDATVEIIDAHGEVAVRVQDVVATAGVPIPVLYRLFGSREGLVQAAQIERLVRDLGGELQQFTDAIAVIEDPDEFRDLIDRILAVAASPDRMPWRWKRVNVLGSTYGRPALTTEVAHIQRQSINAIAELFRRPQEQGWLRPGLDLVAFASWFAGAMLGRLVVELGDDGVDHQAFDELTATAVKHVLFG